CDTERMREPDDVLGPCLLHHLFRGYAARQEQSLPRRHLPHEVAVPILHAVQGARLARRVVDDARHGDGSLTERLLVDVWLERRARAATRGHAVELARCGGMVVVG